MVSVSVNDSTFRLLRWYFVRQLLNLLQKNFNDPFSRFPMRQWGNIRLTLPAVDYRPVSPYNRIGIGPNNVIRTYVYGDRSFRILAKCDTGHFEKDGFLLDNAGIREHKLCRRCQLKEIQVTYRLKQMQSSACLSLRI